VNLWLDDIRDPADFGCDGFNWVKTVGEAKVLLLTGQVEQASLDHDLGACDECMGGKTIEEWLVETDFTAMPNCTHVGSGYDLCLWMAETGTWPKEKPFVHSANPVGRVRMRGVIERYFPQENDGH
jgi:hypothetical protein